MAQATLATADAVLQELYLPAAREQLNNMHVLLGMVETSNKTVQGRRAVLLAHVSRNSGIGARTETGDLPTAGNQGYVEERVPVKYNFARGQITDVLIEATASDMASFHRQLKAEMDGLVTDAKNDYSRQLYNDANASLAQCGTTSSSTTVVLTSPSSTELRLLRQGGLIDIGTTGSPTAVASARTIESVDIANGTVEISGAAVTTTSSHFITRSGAAGNEITGIRSIVNDSGTLFNIDPTVHDVWKSTVDDNGGTNRSVTERLLSKVLEDVYIESGKYPNLALTSYGVRGAIADLLDSQKRFSNTIDLAAGFKAITIAAGNIELPIVVDNFAPNNTLFAVNTAHLTHHVMGSPWSWMDRDGSVLARVADKAAYEFTMRCYSELTTDQRNAHGRINDITEA